MTNVLYYVAVLLECLRHCNDKAVLDRFFDGLREVLLRHAGRG